MVSHIFTQLNVGTITSGHTLLNSIAALVTIVVFLRALWRTVFNRLRHIPGSFSSRLTGFELDLAHFNGRRVYKLEELHEKYGPIVRVGPNEVSLGDWRHLRTIYTANKGIAKEPGFYSGATFVGKHNIFQMADPTEHGARRKLSSPPYSLQSVSRLDPIIKERAEILANRLVTSAKDSTTGTTDAYKLCGLFSFEVVCKAGFAKEWYGESAQEDALSLLEAMDGSSLTFIFNGLMPFLKSGRLGPRIPGFVGEAYRSHERWQNSSRDMVDHFLKFSSRDEKYLLSPLAEGIDRFLGRKLTHEELVEEAMGYMFAGSSTTSSTLGYLLYELSRPGHEHIQERLRKEMMDLPHEDITSIRNNDYVNAVIKETMRVHPTIISTLPRVLTEPLHLDKYVLPTGTVVGMQNWIHHRNPSVFPDPDNFDPDRWLHASEAMESSLTPFSIGRRNCIGQNLAWQELYWAVYTVMNVGLHLKLGAEMKDGDMDMEDRFNVAPRGKRLMLAVARLPTNKV